SFGKVNFSSVFGETLCEIAERNTKVCAITAAMANGTGLENFAKKYPDRFFDVSIAEGHAAAMSAGLACQGMIPVYAVYSTFLQRGYDMLLHDIGISGYHVVLCVDRAGLVGEDGETHHGAFDVAYLSTVPGMTILSPANYEELRDMLRMAVEYIKGPVAIRYPRGGEGRYTEGGLSRSKLLREGSDFTIVTYGTLINEALDAGDSLLHFGCECDIIKLDFISPIDYSAIARSVGKTGRLIVAEECVQTGCVGQRIASELLKRGCAPNTMVLKNLGDRYIPQGTVSELRKMCGIDSESIAAAVLEALKDEQAET
ncbi:MAG: 1-deoxy-D-xylulose-5-phosphate synthase, partial [Oscillospiraceae bacterium]|nr:1-deoxy-D-xylulose-5-phosphate synthase [Oscillospiraceae bacterium]